MRDTNLADGLLPAELEFFSSYAWCLDPYLTVRRALEQIGTEIDKVARASNGWQQSEIRLNIYLLSCAVLNCVDEYLREPAIRLPTHLSGFWTVRTVKWFAEACTVRHLLRRPDHIVRWRERWLAAIAEFLLGAFVKNDMPNALTQGIADLTALLKMQIPRELESERIGVPSPYRHHDLAPEDVIDLGRLYLARSSRRSEKLLLVGLRTSGAYFIPLLHAVFVGAGRQNISMATISPQKGPSRRELRLLRERAAEGYTALVVDDSPDTGGTIFSAFASLYRAGFGTGSVKILVPLHRGRSDVFKDLPETVVTTLKPDNWQKKALLDSHTVECRVSEYYSRRGFAGSKVLASPRADRINEMLRDASSDERGSALKRVFEVQVETVDGRKECRFVLARSVGAGWLGYHAFLAALRLREFVPPMLGLRDGILYSEWLPYPPANAANTRKTAALDAIASYVSARTRRLALTENGPRMTGTPRQANGYRLLRDVLSNAYGGFPFNVLRRRWAAKLLSEQRCPCPTFIDANMRPDQWLSGPGELVKTDYDRHGLGKDTVNIIDPAYDLADAALSWGLSASEEGRLIQRYIEQSGDHTVEERLFFSKLAAGLWGIKRAYDQLVRTMTSERQQAAHQRFMASWDFLTTETARWCGRHCRVEQAPAWRSPLLMLDLDGVLDRRVFGFPSTSAAGIAALGLLNRKGLSVAIDTARSVREVKNYCQAYSLCGGVAEHGSYLWDAVNNRGKVLVSAQAENELRMMREALRRVHGVFLDERHEYSIRAFTYRDRPRSVKDRLFAFLFTAGVGDAVVAPLPSFIVGRLMKELRLAHLSFHQTAIDTTIVPTNYDKGSGLLALREWVLDESAETIAVGDGPHDLNMFRVATRSFAPANISCKSAARLVGCKIVTRPFQQGLLEIAKELTAADRGKGSAGRKNQFLAESDQWFMDLLRAADRPWWDWSPIASRTCNVGSRQGNSKKRQPRIVGLRMW